MPPAITASPSFHSINGPEQAAAMREENASQISGQLLGLEGPLQHRGQVAASRAAEGKNSSNQKAIIHFRYYISTI